MDKAQAVQQQPFKHREDADRGKTGPLSIGAQYLAWVSYLGQIQLFVTGLRAVLIFAKSSAAVIVIFAVALS